ncbi:hypothetical protein D0X99_02895 [Algoriphagus lacus]|uniref:Alpha-L-glutamate ligase-related protein ATP-grasp domain-containing protein n=1 Tax=Algoriphagus lacus TaxID=2056311 RepID=A0A418PX44_9BACT|nr:sugar-transfer associated ATP-grasp domain-containing protein [Algoriphagus lacus]RIW18645.1 hypothetical protein D0X99_02895 [Algoriphagus lacus]
MGLLSIAKTLFRKNQKEKRDAATDFYFNQKAGEAYSGVIAQNPKKKLSQSQEKQVKEYALDVFGAESCIPWLRVYTAFRGEFLEGWMPVNFWGRVVCPSLNGDLQLLGRIKTLTRKFLRSDALPDLIYYVNGTWISVEGESLDKKSAEDFAFANSAVVFLKKDHTGQGHGLIKLNREEFQKLDFSKTGDFVLQAPITQHAFFETLSPGSVASLRITTYKVPGKMANTHQSSIRVGRLGTSFIVGDDCVRLPIWENEGRLYDFGFSGTWELMDRHPDTGVRFFGLKIPNFDSIKQFCQTLHDQNPHFPLIAWDVILNQDNQIQIMEWNTVTPTIGISEAATGPHFKGLGFENLRK